eukprot:332246-Chlamydomonas_euryale.AAC.2
MSPRSPHWAEVARLAADAARCSDALARAAEELSAAGAPGGESSGAGAGGAGGARSEALIPRERVDALLVELDEMAPLLRCSERAGALRARALLSAGRAADAARVMQDTNSGHYAASVRRAPWRLWTKAQVRAVAGVHGADVANCNAEARGVVDGCFGRECA